ncbi:MAG: xanthine dehydrogenase small subunit [Alphaproteobacteria bacterium]|nr:xanthine dehydrogenase small subunit [Alphaproteobacteria bacterium]
MTRPIRFLLGDAEVSEAAAPPTLTLLRYLRERRGLVGTKEGCAEGDCGACTVAIAEPRDGRLAYKAVNACIHFLPAVDGKQVIPIESLGGDHPLQRAMVAHHGSQCGFCTPGFVMSLFALYHRPGRHDDKAIKDMLAGNLCRCTGYRPILDAARDALGEPRRDRFDEAETATLARLETMRGEPPLDYAAAGGRYVAPRSADQLATVLAAHPEARLVGGATDVGLWVTKEMRELPLLVSTAEVEDMAYVRLAGDRLEIGAAATYAGAVEALSALHVDWRLLLRRLGSEQIRAVGTIGGNIANGSPIGDTMPPLIALGASLMLRKGGTRRSLALEDFYLGYRKTALAPGEFVEAIHLTLPPAHRRFAVHKLAKRFDQDISSVLGAFAFDVESGRVVRARLAFGGMAAVPKRAIAAETALTGQPFERAAIEQAMEALGRDFQPLDDHRASAAYRLTAARNLLLKAWLELQGGDSIRIHGHG